MTDLLLDATGPVTALTADRIQSIKYSDAVAKDKSLSGLDQVDTASVRAEIASSLQALTELPEGWDGIDASPPRPRILRAVNNFLNSLTVSGLRSVPSLVPTREGGLLIEWHTNDVDVIIDVSPDEETSSYIAIPVLGIDVEAPLLSIKSEANYALSYLR
jgi:hypothetical protein